MGSQGIPRYSAQKQHYEGNHKGYSQKGYYKGAGKGKGNHKALNYNGAESDSTDSIHEALNYEYEDVPAMLLEKTPWQKGALPDQSPDACATERPGDGTKARGQQHDLGRLAAFAEAYGR